MKEIFRIRTPLVAPSLNVFYSGKHWSMRSTVKNEWRDHFALIKNSIPVFDKFPIAVEAKVYYDDNRGRDSDNAAMACKFFNDCLVKMEKIPDDNCRYIKYTKHEVILNAEEKYTEFIIYDLS